MNIQQTRNFVGKRIDDYIFVELLGSGAFGQVFSAQNIITKETVAIKCVSKVKLKESNGLVGQLLKTEVQVLASCNNINVVKMNKYLESDNNCYLVMEYCNQGDLEQLLRKKGCIKEEVAIQYMKQILNGMRGLHEMKVIHRDLKLANILISNSVLKIGDLGFAKRLESLDGVVKEALGTLGTMAPEIIEFKPYGILADMFSIGAIYYQLLFGVLPFRTISNDDFLKDVKKNSPNLNRNNIQISKQSQELLIKMLNPNPKQRLQWNELYQSPLFSNQVVQRALSQLTVDKVVATQVDLNMNKKVYEQNQQKFDNITNQNMIMNLQSDDPKFEHKQVVDNSKDEELLLQEALTQKHLQQQKTNDLNNVFEKYLNERNTLVFLGTILHEIHQRNHTQNTNVFLPAFIISKKLIIEMGQFLDILKTQRNIYQCAYFIELYTFPQFIAFIKLCDEDYQIQMTYFNGIQQQLQTLLFQMQNKANEQYISESQLAPSLQFDENYRDILINYYMQLQDEKGQSENQDNCINNLSIQVLDTILFDRETKQELLNQKVDEYFEKFNYLTSEQKEEMIDQKIKQIFSF
ncbi:unnamed protein product [Paramecium sonneborni]|uniref:Protein kinase domain-containing protein n=1 Tax=Paramecium sonneborni TaxID=65129 RepID=A0A8S1ME23_9CILI|nr:unnamed protein product [Paramecium sonneborni]